MGPQARPPPSTAHTRPAASDFALFGPVPGDSIANVLRKVESFELSPLSLPAPTTTTAALLGWRPLGAGRAGEHPLPPPGGRAGLPSPLSLPMTGGLGAQDKAPG